MKDKFLETYFVRLKNRKRFAPQQINSFMNKGAYQITCQYLQDI